MAWEFNEAVHYYRKQGAPADQSALIGLLREIQQENGGGIPEGLLVAAARELGVKDSLLRALVKRIPSLRLMDGHCLEICAGPNWGKQKTLSEFVEKTYGSKPKGFTLKYVPCMRMCGKGPNIRWDGCIHHKADPELIRRLVEGLEK